MLPSSLKNTWFYYVDLLIMLLTQMFCCCKLVKVKLVVSGTFLFKFSQVSILFGGKLIAGVADNDDQPCASNIFVGFGQNSKGYSFALNFKKPISAVNAKKTWSSFLQYVRYQKPVT
jgi:hypothetical protein